jgi:D-3-phosphoglycerate dehydrogenase
MDFDSTFVSVEALDELAKIALRGTSDREGRVTEIEAITQAGMSGEIGFGESLEKRLSLFSASRAHVDELVKLLRANVTSSVARHREFFQEHADEIYIVSGGFMDYIVPVVRDFGISADHVLANDFVYDKTGMITGCDLTNLMAQNNGKPRKVASLGLEGRIVMIGDGYSDFQTKAHGPADVFIAFAENVSRAPVISEADYVARNFQDVIQRLALSDKISV